MIALSTQYRYYLVNTNTNLGMQTTSKAVFIGEATEGHKRCIISVNNDVGQLLGLSESMSRSFCCSSDEESATHDARFFMSRYLLFAFAVSHLGYCGYIAYAIAINFANKNENETAFTVIAALLSALEVGLVTDPEQVTRLTYLKTDMALSRDRLPLRSWFCSSFGKYLPLCTHTPMCTQPYIHPPIYTHTYMHAPPMYTPHYIPPPIYTHPYMHTPLYTHTLYTHAPICKPPLYTPPLSYIVFI